MIEHEGIIEHIDGNHIKVRILQQSACSACHAKRYCTAADSSEKTVDVVDYSGQFKVNDRVTIEGKTSLGYKAVWWAYGIPLILIVSMVILSTYMWHLNEIQGALLSVSILAPYYIVLYFLRNKMTKIFTFTIKKSDSSNLFLL
ncbi:SoxR reducing system RseC family protein [Anaerorudis cellulosivorans]|uniref:SoxR reducing system RseC family protein n=1 Tax=Anaerorudis cellulosivorans TaxID=3397862 RepID=UPI0022208FCE|nr:SoxR reducing system RseC family protein [Seramator thermalis]MCW1735805.1 SoxR reducing system RseC family protein [Seramator thermalis]